MLRNDKKYLKNNKWKGKSCCLSVSLKINIYLYVAHNRTWNINKILNCYPHQAPPLQSNIIWIWLPLPTHQSSSSYLHFKRWKLWADIYLWSLVRLYKSTLKYTLLFYFLFTCCDHYLNFFYITLFPPFSSYILIYLIFK